LRQYGIIGRSNGRSPSFTSEPTYDANQAFAGQSENVEVAAAVSASLGRVIF
jgi:hypothetical protein